MSGCDKYFRTSTVLGSRVLLAVGSSKQFQWPAVEEEPGALTGSALVSVTKH